MGSDSLKEAPLRSEPGISFSRANEEKQKLRLFVLNSS